LGVTFRLIALRRNEFDRDLPLFAGKPPGWPPHSAGTGRFAFIKAHLYRRPPARVVSVFGAGGDGVGAATPNAVRGWIYCDITN